MNRYGELTEVELENEQTELAHLRGSFFQHGPFPALFAPPILFVFVVIGNVAWIAARAFPVRAATAYALSHLYNVTLRVPHLLSFLAQIALLISVYERLVLHSMSFVAEATGPFLKALVPRYRWFVCSHFSLGWPVLLALEIMEVTSYAMSRSIFCSCWERGQ